MIRKILVCVVVAATCLLLPDFATEPTSTPMQHQDVTTREYWIERGYEVITDAWCAGTNVMVQLYKDHEVITINYREHRVSSCRGSYDGCYSDYTDEVIVLHTGE